MFCFPPISSAAQTPEADAGVVTYQPPPATAARIEALQKLATGEHPGVPIDSLLSVSLDDDSSMLEHDASLRLQRRNVLIAIRAAERFKNRSEEEVAKMRDQMLALELERKVLALPIEVRSRLVEEDGQLAQQGGKPVATSGPPAPPATPSAEPEAPSMGDAAKAEPKAAGPGTTPAAGPAARGRSGWARWGAFLGILFGTWLAGRLVNLGAQRLSQRFLEGRARLQQLATVTRFLIYVVGLTLAVMLPFELSQEVSTVILGTLALTLAFACKDFAASVLAGLILIVERPFEVGDRVDFGGISGKVTEIGLLSVRLTTPQKRNVSIPNNEFLTKLVSATQPSAVATSLQVDFYIDSNQDIAAAKRIVEEAIQNTRCVDVPKPRVILVNQVLLERMVTVRLRIRVFVLGTQPEHEIESELTERVLEGFRSSGIRTPAFQLPPVHKKGAGA